MLFAKPEKLGTLGRLKEIGEKAPTSARRTAVRHRRASEPCSSTDGGPSQGWGDRDVAHPVAAGASDTVPRPPGDWDAFRRLHLETARPEKAFQVARGSQCEEQIVLI